MKLDEKWITCLVDTTGTVLIVDMLSKKILMILFIWHPVCEMLHYYPEIVWIVIAKQRTFYSLVYSDIWTYVSIGNTAAVKKWVMLCFALLS